MLVNKNHMLVNDNNFLLNENHVLVSENRHLHNQVALLESFIRQHLPGVFHNRRTLQVFQRLRLRHR